MMKHPFLNAYVGTTASMHHIIIFHKVISKNSFLQTKMRVMPASWMDGTAKKMHWLCFGQKDGGNNYVAVILAWYVTLSYLTLS